MGLVVRRAPFAKNFRNHNWFRATSIMAIRLPMSYPAVICNVVETSSGECEGHSGQAEPD